MAKRVVQLSLQSKTVTKPYLQIIFLRHEGCVVIGGARISVESIEAARKVGVVALIGGGMDDQDLRDFLGYDLGVAITGSEKKGSPSSLQKALAISPWPSRTFDLLKKFEGKEASVNGATQIRAGVMRPEIIIPLEAGDCEEETDKSAGISKLVCHFESSAILTLECLEP